MTDYKLSEAISRRREEYWAKKGIKQKFDTYLLTCPRCKSRYGTFKKTADGKNYVHVDCPGRAPHRWKTP